MCEFCDALPEIVGSGPEVVSVAVAAVIKKEETTLIEIALEEEVFDPSTYENAAPYLDPEPTTSYIAYTGKSVSYNFGLAVDPDLNPIEVKFDLGDLASYATVNELSLTIDGNLTESSELVGEVFQFTIELRDDPLFNAKTRLYTFTLEFYQGFSEFTGVAVEVIEVIETEPVVE